MIEIKLLKIIKSNCDLQNKCSIRFASLVDQSKDTTHQLRKAAPPSDQHQELTLRAVRWFR